MSNNTPNPEPKPESAPEPIKLVDQANVGNNVRASWNFSLDDVRANIAYQPAEAKAALVAAFLWCIDHRHPVAKPEFAARIGLSDNTVYKIYTGKYRMPGSNELVEVKRDTIRQINAFLELEKERYEGGENEFIITPTAKRIFVACELARESQSPVFIWGPSHIGKSMALEYHTATHNHGRTVYCRFKAASGLGGMIKRIADKCGVSDKSNAAALVDRIKNALTKDTLLILDEVHELTYTYRKESFFACLEVIREIYDETHCGMVLCGTQLLMDKIGGAKHAEMEQLFRRGVHKVALPVMPTKEDVTLILKRTGLEFPSKGQEVIVGSVREKPYEILRQCGLNDGLKAITERLRYGRKLAAKAGEKLTWNHVVDAHLRILKQAQQQGPWD